MSAIARLFIVLNLLLSVAFVVSGVMLLQKSEDYRGKWETEQRGRATDKTAAEAEIGKQKAEAESVRKSLATAQEEATAARTERDQLKIRIDKAEAQNTANTAEIAKIAANLENFRVNNDNLQKQKDDSVKSSDAMRAERDTAKKAQEDAENAMAQAQEGSKQLQSQVDALKVQVTDTTEKLKGAQLALEIYSQRTGIPLEQVAVAAPLMTGNVVDVAAQSKLIQINIGADSGMKRGYSLSIYRGSVYKGEAIVEDVQPKFSTARITKPVPGKQVEAGDMVTTRLF